MSYITVFSTINVSSFCLSVPLAEALKIFMLNLQQFPVLERLQLDPPLEN